MEKGQFGESLCIHKKELGEATFSASLDIEPCEAVFSGYLCEKH
jgi:hypothetical protein